MMPTTVAEKFPAGLIWIGWLVTIPSLLLAADIAWEQTFLTWTNGPQMIGFSLIHAGPGVFLVLAMMLGVAWAAAVAIVAVRRRAFGGKVVIGLCAAYALSLLVVLIPSGIWQRPFVSKLAAGSHATEFLFAAAGEGDTSLVKALLRRGVPVNARSSSGSTALHAAAVEGEVPAIETLLAAGADVNVLDEVGNSPMREAVLEHHAEAVRVLALHGGKSIRRGEPQDKFR